MHQKLFIASLLIVALTLVECQFGKKRRGFNGGYGLRGGGGFGGGGGMYFLNSAASREKPVLEVSHQVRYKQAV